MPLKAMINLTSRNLLAVADALGNIYLMDTTSTDLEIVRVLSIETGAQIRGLACNIHENFIVAGSSDLSRQKCSDSRDQSWTCWIFSRD